MMLVDERRPSRIGAHADRRVGIAREDRGVARFLAGVEGARLFPLGAVFFGFSLASSLYRNATRDPIPAAVAATARALRNRFYLDEIYDVLFVRLQDAIAALADAFDRWIIAGLFVRGLHGTTELVGRGLRLVQTGNLQTYAFLSVLGTAFVLYLVIRR